MSNDRWWAGISTDGANWGAADAASSSTSSECDCSEYQEAVDEAVEERDAARTAMTDASARMQTAQQKLTATDQARAVSAAYCASQQMFTLQARAAFEQAVNLVTPLPIGGCISMLSTAIAGVDAIATTVADAITAALTSESAFLQNQAIVGPLVQAAQNFHNGEAAYKNGTISKVDLDALESAFVTLAQNAYQQKPQILNEATQTVEITELIFAKLGALAGSASSVRAPAEALYQAMVTAQNIATNTMHREASLYNTYLNWKKALDTFGQRLDAEDDAFQAYEDALIAYKTAEFEYDAAMRDENNARKQLSQCESRSDCSVDPIQPPPPIDCTAECDAYDTAQAAYGEALENLTDAEQAVTDAQEFLETERYILSVYKQTLDADFAGLNTPRLNLIGALVPCQSALAAVRVAADALASDTKKVGWSMGGFLASATSALKTVASLLGFVASGGAATNAWDKVQTDITTLKNKWGAYYVTFMTLSTAVHACASAAQSYAQDLQRLLGQLQYLDRAYGSLFSACYKYNRTANAYLSSMKSYFDAYAACQICEAKQNILGP
jgi:hypothetical protein